ncbi:hypothetical protein CCS79_17275 [Clostridium diolis]|uniref:YhfC family intramembrane metalloprotease n=1 Tax=Clostridium diolis TaxID=223919 RepID=UPI000B3F912D|nr:YhfC family glutamic-type intramembrane protease [Clostridium diolis]OVE66730.1 hypothetical protein CCS79_17275 [Clostridium diolis]
MKEVSLIICFIINIIICFGIPFGTLIYIIINKKNAGKSFFVGTCVFFIFQVLIRMPLLRYVLSQMEWYNVMASANPIEYGLFLGLTAGLFEEVGRFLGFKIILQKNLRWIDGIVFGIGHGGMEAVLFVGVSCIQNLMMLISLNNGILNYTQIGMSEQSVRASFATTTNVMVLMGGVERIFTFIIHAGLTLIILHGIKKNKFIYLGLAIFIHTIVDSAVVILPKVFNIGIIEIELFIGMLALLILIYIVKSIKIFERLEGVNINEKFDKSN